MTTFVIYQTILKRSGNDREGPVEKGDKGRHCMQDKANALSLSHIMHVIALVGVY
jgi:hypothetical protein